MKQRLITGLIIVGILIPLLVVPQLLEVFHVVAAIFAGIGAIEVVRLSEKEKKYNFGIKIIIIVSTLLIYISGLGIWQSLHFELDLPLNSITLVFNSQVSFALILASVLLQLSMLVFSKDFDAKDIGKSFAASFYVGLGVASIVALRGYGVRYVVYLFLITILTDVFAYVYGMLFGNHKMIERISPKKSWEGAIGGTIVGTLVATLFAFNYGYLFAKTGDGFVTLFDNFKSFAAFERPIQFMIIFGITLVASMISQVGDLVASKLKRTYDIKDFGKIFPGHGGFLDRFDSAIYTGMFLLMIFLVLSQVIA